MKDKLVKGTLKRWNGGKGFGFIAPDDNGEDVFVHISELKRAGRRPRVGDIISYSVATRDDGKHYAINTSIEGVDNSDSSRNRKQNNNQSTEVSGGSAGKAILIIVALAVLGFIAYKYLM